MTLRHAMPLLLVGAVGCSHGETLCAPSIATAIAIYPIDDSSGAPLAPTVFATAGFTGYADTLVGPPEVYIGPDSLAGGFRKGTYAVHAESPGYLPYDTTGIVVRLSSGACPDFITQRFTVRMSAAP